MHFPDVRMEEFKFLELNSYSNEVISSFLLTLSPIILLFPCMTALQDSSAGYLSYGDGRLETIKSAHLQL